jgi:hypothetical protein
MWALCGMWGKGIKKRVGGIWNSFKTFGRCKILTWRVKERNGKRSMYFACDFNGRWLKDSSFLCCIDVLLSVEGKIV